MPATSQGCRYLILAFTFIFSGITQTELSATAASNSLRFLSRETEALACRLELIERATVSISIATYQIRDDNSGGQLIAALVDAASRGVEVRLLVDAHPNSNNLPKPLMRYLVERGVSIRERPFDVRSKLELGRPRLHDKLFIADSSILILGGRNLEQDYFGLGNRQYIDYDVIVEGEVACEVQAYFEERWTEPESATPRLAGREEPKMLKKQVHAHWNKGSYCEVVPEIESWLAELRDSELQACDMPCRNDFIAQEHDSCCIEFLRDYSNGSKRSPEAISSRIIAEIKSAKHNIAISTPYFVVPIYLRNALIEASKRGVQVTLLTNSLESTDQVVVHAAYTNIRRSLIRNGIEIYEQRGENPLHAKLIVIDGSKTIVGSHNLDMLSMKRNSEVGLLINNVAFAEEAMVFYRSMISQSEGLNDESLFLYEKRTSPVDGDKLEQYQKLRLVAPFIRRYL
ncbi:MAG: phosphatidylserine/phosphatidylglycerophosphate/cardiolipin synthase family protein [Pirellula sp.]|nr:phosphatidylserine/phosphatidylglycerophosphate/cardiolipin synthase family protein [Pirellula sp.]